MKDLEEIINYIKGSRKTMFIVCGFPYSGKTYFVNKIVNATGVSLVSIDKIFYNHGFDWDTNNLPQEHEWNVIFNEAYEKIKSILKKGENVVYDSTNHTKESRDILRRQAEAVDGESKIIYIKTTQEAVWNRWHQNLKTKERAIVDKKLMQITIEAFEEPSADENVLYIHNDYLNSLS